MPAKTITMPAGARLISRSQERALLFEFSGRATAADLGAGVCAGWLFRLPRRYKALSLDVRDADLPADRSEAEELLRAALLPGARMWKGIPAALLVAPGYLGSARELALHLACEGALLGVFTEKETACAWLRAQVLAHAEQERWLAARLARQGHMPAGGPPGP